MEDLEEDLDGQISENEEEMAALLREPGSSKRAFNNELESEREPEVKVLP